MISHRLWRRRFGGKSDLIEKKIYIEGEAYTVIGIMPPGFDHPSPWLIGEKADLWMSIHSRSFMENVREHRGKLSGCYQ